LDGMELTTNSETTFSYRECAILVTLIESNGSLTGSVTSQAVHGDRITGTSSICSMNKTASVDTICTTTSSY
jgi:hypothetical protein